MNAVDRYLDTVKQLLPKAQRDEVVGRLADDIHSKVRAREAGLDRPLNDADLEAIVERLDSPMQVAARYRSRDARLAIGVELIGPGLFPHYLKWLAIPVGLTLALFAAAVLAGKRPTPTQMLLPIAIQGACVTLIFTLIQVAEKYGWPHGRKKPSPPVPELLRRYLHAVRFWLPKANREDIVAELADDLRSRIEDRERELGRALDTGDVVAILKQRGDPMTVASSYLPPQYLIGPVLFPIYRFVVKLVVLWIITPIYLFIVGPIVIQTAANAALAGIHALWSLLMSAVFSVGVITVVFAIIERRPHPSLHEWDPRKLPAAPARRFADDLEPMPWYRAVASIFVSALFSLAWVYFANRPVAAEFEGVGISLAPVWHSLFWPVLAALLTGAAVGLAGLLRPDAPRLHAAIRLAGNVLSLVVVGVLLNARSWIEITALDSRGAGLEESAKWTNFSLWISLLVVGVILAVDAIREARRLFRGDRRSTDCPAAEV